MGRGHGHTSHSHHSSGHRSGSRMHHTTHHSSTHHSSSGGGGSSCKRPWTKDNYCTALVIVFIFVVFFAFPVIVISSTTDFNHQVVEFSANLGYQQQFVYQLSSYDDDDDEIQVTSALCSNFTTCQMEGSKFEYEERNYTYDFNVTLESGYYLHKNFSSTTAPLTIKFSMRCYYGTVYIFNDEEYQLFHDGRSYYTPLKKWTDVVELSANYTSNQYSTLHLCMVPRSPSMAFCSGWYSGQFIKMNESSCIHKYTGNCTLASVGHRHYVIVENTNAPNYIDIKAFSEYFSDSSLTIILIFAAIDLVFIILFLVCCGFCMRAPKTRPDPNAGKVTQDVTPGGAVQMGAVAGAGPTETGPPPPAAYAGAGPAYPGSTPQGAVAVTPGDAPYPGAAPYPGQDDNVYGVPM